MSEQREHLFPDAIQIHVFHHFSTPLVIQTQSPQDDLLKIINAKLDKIMSTLADLQAAVTAEDTVIDSAVTLIQGLAAQVAALQPNQAAIDALAADIKAKSDGLAAAVAAGTTPPAA